jgi:uncharacterized protein YeaO (DUF488 family)
MLVGAAAHLIAKRQKVVGSSFNFLTYLEGLRRIPVVEIAMAASTAQLDIKLKRAYEPPAATDGTRVLIDRLWPRGVTKEEAAIDHWLRDIAPSTELRRWFGHDVSLWDEFRRRYTAELKHHTEQLDELLRLARQGRVTLVFGARDEEHNDAVVLRHFVLEHSKRRVSRT